MGRLGVKTSSTMRRGATQEGAEFISFFRVLSRTGQELIVGEDDRHLDF
jgi:hypothetical protein